jgi:hypothetical protein
LIEHQEENWIKKAIRAKNISQGSLSQLFFQLKTQKMQNLSCQELIDSFNVMFYEND